MRFGPVPLAEAEGGVLAHSVALGATRLRKGRVLSGADVEQLAAGGVAEVVIARLEPGDVPEDEAAARLGGALALDPAALGLTVSAPFTGRVNLHAARPGLLRLDRAAVDALNRIDEALTLATLEPGVWLRERQMVATVKVIPYAAPGSAVEAAESLLLSRAAPVLRVSPLLRRSAGIILTETPGMAPKVVEKGADAVRRRLAALGVTVAAETVVPHQPGPLAQALAKSRGEMLLILTGSATSDRNDVGPAALIAAGGELERFGMPVDPGNLLFLGRLGPRPVIGLPGCARSPKLNGADWVIERIATGLELSSDEIAVMGVGGLLKEIPSRPAPRAGTSPSGARPRIGAVILAAGASSRMGGRDKLVEEAGSGPLLARVAAAVAGSGVDETFVVLRARDTARAGALGGQGVRIVENPRAAEGMGTSIAAGVAALAPGADAALVVMGDMPDVTSGDVDRLIAAFDPEEGREIVRARAPDGRPGHPVLFGRRFFEALRALDGDAGARDLVREHAEFLVEVELPGRAALTDLDTPEDWRRWREGVD